MVSPETPEEQGEYKEIQPTASGDTSNDNPDNTITKPKLVADDDGNNRR